MESKTTPINALSSEERRRREAIDILVEELAMDGTEDNEMDSLEEHREDLTYVYIRNALERGWTTGFVESLRACQKQKEQEIDKICSKHYESFLDSMNEVLNIRSSIEELTRDVVNVNKDFKSAGHDLSEIMTSFERLTKERDNVQKLCSSLAKCRQVAYAMRDVRREMEGKNDHFNAIKLLKIVSERKFSLETESFTLQVDDWLHKMSSKMMESTKDDLQKYFAKIRACTSKVGEALLIRSAKQQVEPYNLKSMTPPATGSLCYLEQKCGPIFRWSKWAIAGEFQRVVPLFFTLSEVEPGKPLDPLDILFHEQTALHRATHVFASLDNLSEFHRYYRSCRLPMLSKQIRDVGVNGANLTEAELDELVKVKGLPEVLNDVISNIVGFFGIECIARHTSDQQDYLFSLSQLTSMFDFACEEVDLLVRKHFTTIRNPDVALQVKEQIVLMCELMADETFDLRSKTVYGTIQYMWSMYCFLLEGVMMHNTMRALGKGQYQPFYVSSEHKHETYIKSFNLENIEVDIASDRYFPNNDECNRIGGTDSSGKEWVSSMISRANSTSVLANETSSLDPPKVDSATMAALANVDSLEALLEKEMRTTANGSNISSGASKRDSIPSKSTIENKPTNLPPSSFASLQIPPLSALTSQSKFVGKSYPFSCAVPCLVRDFYVLFTRVFLYSINNPYFNVTGSSICDLLGNALYQVKEIMTFELQKDDLDTPISKACQISVDAVAVSQALVHCRYIIAYALAHFQKQESVATDMVSMFTRVRGQFEDLAYTAHGYIYELLQSKLEDLMSSLVFVNWSAEKAPRAPNDAVLEMVEFMTVTFQWLSNLPATARDSAHFMCCSKISSGIIEHLRSKKLAKISIFSVSALDLDVKHLEAFAESTGVPQLKQCFDELKSLIGCLLDAQFAHDATHNAPIAFFSSYRHLDLECLADIFEKMFTPSSGSILGSLTKLDRGQPATIAKRLRAAIAAGSSAHKSKLLHGPERSIGGGTAGEAIVLASV